MLFTEADIKRLVVHSIRHYYDDSYDFSEKDYAQNLHATFTAFNNISANEKLNEAFQKANISTGDLIYLIERSNNAYPEELRLQIAIAAGCYLLDILTISNKMEQAIPIFAEVKNRTVFGEQEKWLEEYIPVVDAMYPKQLLLIAMLLTYFALITDKRFGTAYEKEAHTALYVKKLISLVPLEIKEYLCADYADNLSRSVLYIGSLIHRYDAKIKTLSEISHSPLCTTATQRKATDDLAEIVSERREWVLKMMTDNITPNDYYLKEILQFQDFQDLGYIDPFKLSFTMTFLLTEGNSIAWLTPFRNHLFRVSSQYLPWGNEEGTPFLKSSEEGSKLYAMRFHLSSDENAETEVLDAKKVLDPNRKGRTATFSQLFFNKGKLLPPRSLILTSEWSDKRIEKAFERLGAKGLSEIIPLMYMQRKYAEDFAAACLENELSSEENIEPELVEESEVKSQLQDSPIEDKDEELKQLRNKVAGLKSILAEAKEQNTILKTMMMSRRTLVTLVVSKAAFFLY